MYFYLFFWMNFSLTKFMFYISNLILIIKSVYYINNCSKNLSKLSINQINLVKLYLK